jgi:hypothetical protein
MNDYQDEKLDSNKLVVKIARENQETTNLIPDFADGITRQEEINNEIDRIRILQEKDNSGVTENKNYTLKSLLDQTLDISGAVHSYAVKKEDTQVMSKVDFKVRTLSKMVPGKLISAAGTTLEEAKKVPSADLAKTGISSDELKAYEEIVEHYKSISNSPRATQIEVSVYTKQLLALFKESGKLYKQSMDRLARQFKTKAPEYYMKYHAARKAIHRGGSDSETPTTDDSKKIG